ncbi:MAG: ABC transporter ATP-binding protein [Candidatus Hydrothermarchaeota archaeon]|nr:MAG: ABC transporter ATP-binding protein [Candidatus Hydrothermarchaeota archaeon]
MFEVRELSKRFGGIQAVDNVSFDVRSKEIVGLVGPNGAGKTTLINLITGIIKPDSGRVIFNSEDITNLKPHEICRRGISRTFQSVQVFEEMNALENVALALLFGRANKSIEEAREEAREILSFVDFPEKYIDKEARDLNIVELKRIQLARALATKPKLLLLDEVTTGLNPKECDEAVEIIKKIRDSGITILMVEHVMRIIMNVSDRIVVLNHGKKIAEGTPEEVSSDEKVIESYLGERFLW